jgi:2-polyprenyl-3-methyl-5-hydroxy-6-metoxy-1,4-benzoquinol methylase
MIKAEAMKPFGIAIKDYYAGDSKAAVRFYREDGEISDLAISSFFRGPTDIKLDGIALDNCRGRVLDVGAGVGIHSLYLQNKGFYVCAMDVSSEACEVMRKRGVKEVRRASFAYFKAEPFDTLLILGRSIGMVENIAGLDNFLRDARQLVKRGGQIILNSLDVSKTTDLQHLAYHKTKRQAGQYIGEIKMRLEYKGVKGPVTGFLHVDATTLAGQAEKADWLCEILVQEEDGNYLARLTRKN